MATTKKAAKTTRTAKRMAKTPEAFRVPRSARMLGEAILRRMTTSPNYWAEVARVVMAGTATAKQVEPREMPAQH